MIRAGLINGSGLDGDDHAKRLRLAREEPGENGGTLPAIRSSERTE